MTVLIADDLDVSRKDLRASLQADGLRTVEAEDGRQALEVLKREAVDCVITDVLMPVMDGYRLCQEIRASESFYSLPIIVCTSTYTSASDEKLALEAGADAYLKKPVPAEILGKTIRAVTARPGKKERKHPQPDAVLKQFNEALIRKLEERTVQLEREQERLREIAEALGEVFQAQKMEEIGRLAGGVAHNFNNLMTAILCLSELSLGALPADHPIRPDLEEIKSTGYRAARLTRQLLAFSRRQIFAPETLDLNALVRKIESLLARVIGEEVQLTLKLAPSLEPVLADPAQIEQVLLNLCGNALDAMSRGGRLAIESGAVSLAEELRCQRFSIPRGDYATLRVSDSGAGMSEAVQARLFEPFFTTKPVGKGAGLGLSACYGIIKQSGGFIRAESEPGKGSRFTIYLPALRGKAREALD